MAKVGVTSRVRVGFPKPRSWTKTSRTSSNQSASRAFRESDGTHLAITALARTEHSCVVPSVTVKLFFIHSAVGERRATCVRLTAKNGHTRRSARSTLSQSATRMLLRISSAIPCPHSLNYTTSHHSKGNFLEVCNEPSPVGLRRARCLTPCDGCSADRKNMATRICFRRARSPNPKRCAPTCDNRVSCPTSRLPPRLSSPDSTRRKTLASSPLWLATPPKATAACARDLHPSLLTSPPARLAHLLDRSLDPLRSLM